MDDTGGLAAWLDLFYPALCKDSNKAARAAKLFHDLLAELESGPEGVTRVAACLEDALRLAFSFTRVSRACLILFEVSLGEDFPPNLNPTELLTESTRRMKAELERASTAQSKKSRKR